MRHMRCVRTFQYTRVFRAASQQQTRKQGASSLQKEFVPFVLGAMGTPYKKTSHVTNRSQIRNRLSYCQQQPLTTRDNSLREETASRRIYPLQA